MRITRATQGLGLVGTGRRGALGIWLHSSLAFTPEGAALGLVDVQQWIRDPKEFGKAASRHRRPIEEKESYRWLKSFQATVQWAKGNPGTRVINIADREGDLYELFALAARHPEVGVLVRSRHKRKDQSGIGVDQLMTEAPQAGTVEIEIPRQPGQASRKATLAVKHVALSLGALRGRRADQPIGLWIVQAEEIPFPQNRAKPLFWRLVTNVAASDFPSAIERIEWYRRRWSIEEFHRILKSGCRVEARQLETVERLGKIIMMDLLVAWRVLELSRAARQPERRKAEESLAEDELQVLKQWQLQNAQTPVLSLTVRDAVRLIAQLGGFLARKRDGEPGPMTLWRGLERLSQLTLGYQLAKSCG